MQLLPQYTHIVNCNLKHTYLSFDSDGNLIIKSPKVSKIYLEKLLLKKANWITRSRKKIEQKKANTLDFTKPATLYYLGKKYDLFIHQHKNKHCKVHFDESAFTLYYKHYDEEEFQKAINNFYKEEAKRVIPVFVHKWSDTMNLTPNKLSFRKTKRQWGSCSANNNLSFNTMLMKLPIDVINYVIVHELAHIKHKHHQKSFWACVKHYLPNYQKHVQELKQYFTT